MADRVSDNLAMLMRVVDRLSPLEDFAVVKIGFRVPSLKKRIRARTSWKRALRHRAGLKAPRGWGWVTNPKKAAYNRVYQRTTRGCLVVLGFASALVVGGVAAFAAFLLAP